MMYRKSYKLFFHAIQIFLLFLMLSCEKVFLPPEGKMVSEKFNLDTIEEILVNDVFDIILVNDSNYSVTVVAGENRIGGFRNSEAGRLLVLEDHNKYKWLPEYNRIRLEIRFPDLKRITLEAPSSIKTRDTLYISNFQLYSLGKTAEMDLNLKGGTLYMVTGSDNFGVYHLSGQVNHCSLWPRGSSIVHAENLESRKCVVKSNTIGATRVYPLRELHVRMNTLGDVLYRGNPDTVIIEEQSGEGKLLKLEE